METGSDDLRVLVFGGTGFLGRRVVEVLRAARMQVLVASRHPGADPAGQSAQADVTDPVSVSRAVEGMDAVVNCVSLYVETADTTFEDVHVKGAGALAAAARQAGVSTLVQISGVGSDASSRSDYVRARGRGEVAVREGFPQATLLRPTVMFGPGDAFLTAIADIAAKSPVFPLFGAGSVRLQPVFVNDVADAVRTVVSSPSRRGGVNELGGPDVLSYRRIVELVMDWSGRRRLLVPFPMAGWQAMAGLSRLLPSPPITEGQVALMKRDNIVCEAMPGLQDLRVSATSMSDVAPSYLTRSG